jgi:hypothetical protein
VIALSLALFASAGDAHGGAVQAVAQETARQLAATVAQTVVVSAPLESDQPAPKGDGLGRTRSCISGAR